jgi:cytosine/adenosine deaminase-related metal-dependent hydrolase
MNFTLLNARLGSGDITSLRVAGARIAALGSPPARGDAVVDLRGDRLLPGLINAHDHLQLNTLPPLDHRLRYTHVQEWIAAVDDRRRSDPLFEAGVAVPRDARLWVGGIKNLLSGVTTVAHHDPLYPLLTEAHYPVAVVSNYGWSHSLYLDGHERVHQAYRATPAGWPWVIHAAEGITDEAAQEFDRLDALGCLGPNTLLVHGIALDPERRQRLRQAAAGLIWCPSSNLRLFGRTAEVSDLIAGGDGAVGSVALGTDSRLSGARDLLDELRIAAEVSGLDDRALEPLVTGAAARLLRLSDRGTLQVGMRADLLVIPGNGRLTQMSRARVGLVLLAGKPLYGEYAYGHALSAANHGIEVHVDGCRKFLGDGLARQLIAMNIHEAGLELTARRTPVRKFS